MSLRQPTDEWEHAADNSRRCFDLAISELRKRLEAARTKLLITLRAKAALAEKK